jgi:hypothetical protein
MNAYAETEPIMDYNQDETQDNAMPVWLWLISMILMPAVTGLMTGMLENGWLPETFRIMLSNAQGTQETEEAEKDDKTE